MYLPEVRRKYVVGTPIPWLGSFFLPFRPTNIAVVVPSLGQPAPGVWRLGARFPARPSAIRSSRSLANYLSPCARRIRGNAHVRENTGVATSGQ